MNTAKPKFSKLKSEAFQVPERLDASVDMGLFPETVISFFSSEHHGHPVITGVIHNFFRAYAIYSFHKDFFSCRVLEGAGESLPHATKKEYGLMGEKRDAAFHLRVLRYAPDRAVFSAAVNKKKKKKIFLIILYLGFITPRSMCPLMCL